MCWRAQKPRLSVEWSFAQTRELVCAMAFKMYPAFIVLFSVVLTLASSKSFGRSSAENGGRSALARSGSHRSFARSLNHHHGPNRGAFWPGGGSFVYEPSNGEPKIDVTRPISGDVHYTCTYDIPWDWVHRCPTFIKPSEPISAPVVIPHVPGCPTQTAKVLMGDGKEETISIVRCY